MASEPQLPPTPGALLAYEPKPKSCCCWPKLRLCSGLASALGSELGIPPAPARDEGEFMLGDWDWDCAEESEEIESESEGGTDERDEGVETPPSISSPFSLDALPWFWVWLLLLFCICCCCICCSPARWKCWRNDCCC